jgi:hypothetical protein
MVKWVKSEKTSVKIRREMAEERNSRMGGLKVMMCEVAKWKIG